MSVIACLRQLPRRRGRGIRLRRWCFTKGVDYTVDFSLLQLHASPIFTSDKDCEPVLVSSIEQMQHDVLPAVRQSAGFKPSIVLGLERENIGGCGVVLEPKTLNFK